MKTIAFLIASLASSFVFAQETVTVSMSNIPNDKGYVAVGLYTEDTFMKASPDYHARAKINEGTAKTVFENIPAGEYAVAVYHDENENQKMDFETNGMPKEAYGSSNNIPNPFGPPRWEDAKFNMGDKPLSLEIKLVGM